MHYVLAKGILSSNQRVNIYRGCEHNCIYCDARSTVYKMEHDFLDIEVKENALELLEEELTKKKKKMVICTGSMSDPYMPLEKHLHMTREMLERIYLYGHGVHIQTKSDLVLRDLDILQKINKNKKASVSITITTIHDSLCKIIEPGAPVTSKRLETLEKLHEAGIPTYVWICPLLPFITDSLDNLRDILFACKRANVKGIIYFDFLLTLREGDREHFYQMLDEHFPGMKAKYIKQFGNNYSCPSPYQKYLKDYLIRFCEENQILHYYEEIEHEIMSLDENPGYEQLSLF